MPRGRKRCERELRAVDHAVQVDVDLARGGRVALLGEAAELHDPGVVDQHVERAELLLGLVEEALERRRGRSRRAAARASPPPSSAAVRSASSTSRSPIATFAPLRDERRRGRAADAAGAAGDRDDLAGERAGLLGHASLLGLRRCGADWLRSQSRGIRAVAACDRAAD